MHLHADFLLPAQPLKMQTVSFTELQMNLAHRFILPSLRKSRN